MSGQRTRGGDLPLLAWGEDLRRRKVERRRLRRCAALVGGGVGAVLLSIVLPPMPLLVWNASASAPVGLYAVSHTMGPHRGDMVIARVPLAVRELAASRRYIPANVPLVKHVGAVPGDTVCAFGNVITIERVPAAVRYDFDWRGRTMPRWFGCRLLRQGDVFLLSPAAPGSFDGRYFGVTSSADVVGIARPLWLR
ncbi:S26 family signal peptidase [Sphingopyxis sp. 550A]